MSVYIDNDYEINCRFSWNNPPEKPNDCKKCLDNDWCPLSLATEYVNEHRQKRKETA